MKKLLLLSSLAFVLQASVRADAYLEGVDLTRSCASVAWSDGSSLDTRVTIPSYSSVDDICPFDSHPFWPLMGLPMNFRSDPRPQLFIFIR